jgi:hypothetical protein
MSIRSELAGIFGIFAVDEQLTREAEKSAEALLVASTVEAVFFLYDCGITVPESDRPVIVSKLASRRSAYIQRFPDRRKERRSGGVLSSNRNLPKAIGF